jgi:hypothetical protein
MQGYRKVVEVDEESCNKELLERYYKAEQEKAQDAYNDRYTMWMESGGREPMY